MKKKLFNIWPNPPDRFWRQSHNSYEVDDSNSTLKLFFQRNRKILKSRKTFGVKTKCFDSPQKIKNSKNFSLKSWRSNARNALWKSIMKTSCLKIKGFFWEREKRKSHMCLRLCSLEDATTFGVGKIVPSLIGRSLGDWE